MSDYLPSTPAQRQDMLDELGYKDVGDLYSAIPENLLLQELDLPEGISELELTRLIQSLADKNVVFPSIFRGGGAYYHFIPALVKSTASKEEFVSAYTPYQAEISQGILQSIFEYQTMVCELTGMDVSNASLYDGATSAAEAVLMCQERKRSKVVVSQTLNPQWIEVVQTYCESRDVELIVIPSENGATDISAFEAALDESCACALFQHPNYFGVLEDPDALIRAAHDKGAKAIMATEPTSLGILKTPGELNADICVCEGQPLGIPLSFGGPYLGIITCTKALTRKLPGRIVGQTIDSDGNRAFVLTLQAREQHIRREKASSNVCSNQALCALIAGSYLACMGPDGISDVAQQSYAKAQYAAEKICAVEGFSLAFDQPFFNEFVSYYHGDIQALETYLAKQGILSGLPLMLDSSGHLCNDSARICANAILWCTTEMNTKEEIDALVSALKTFATEASK